MARATTPLLRGSRAGLLMLALACVPAAARAQEPAPDPLELATQLLVVTTPDWDATTGELRRFERDGLAAPWRPVGGAAGTPVVVGRSGLAWGVGFDTLAGAPGASGPLKREGDGRAPAGVFALGTAFGFAPADSMPSVELPYLMLGPGTECVDDTASAHYARVVDRADVADADWESAERMRTISLYRLGVVVDYNGERVPGRGSCIFLHIWAGPGSTTAGCTALDADPLAALMAWLGADARPAMVQLPAVVYETFRADWGLPPLRR